MVIFNVSAVFVVTALAAVNGRGRLCRYNAKETLA